MSFRRHTRSLAALVAVAALLFAPLAVSVHACPRMGDMSAAMAGMAADDGAMDDANLCERHCNDGKASFDAANPASPAPVAIAPAMRVAIIETGAWRAPYLGSPFGFASAAPPLIGFTVLRI